MWIRSQTKLKDIAETIMKSKWQWVGHVMRRTDDRWSRRLAEWYPWTGLRQRGGPPRRPRDCEVLQPALGTDSGWPAAVDDTWGGVPPTMERLKPRQGNQCNMKPVVHRFYIVWSVVHTQVFFGKIDHCSSLQSSISHPSSNSPDYRIQLVPTFEWKNRIQVTWSIYFID